MRSLVLSLRQTESPMRESLHPTDAAPMWSGATTEVTDEEPWKGQRTKVTS